MDYLIHTYVYTRTYGRCRIVGKTYGRVSYDIKLRDGRVVSNIPASEFYETPLPSAQILEYPA